MTIKSRTVRDRFGHEVAWLFLGDAGGGRVCIVMTGHSTLLLPSSRRAVEAVCEAIGRVGFHSPGHPICRSGDVGGIGPMPRDLAEAAGPALLAVWTKAADTALDYTLVMTHVDTPTTVPDMLKAPWWRGRPPTRKALVSLLDELVGLGELAVTRGRYARAERVA